MKEQAPDSLYKSSGVICNGQGHEVDVICTAMSSAQRGRFKHQSFTYKGNIFVHGGTTIPSSSFSDDPLDLYCLDLQREGEKRWEKIKTKYANNTKEVQTVNAHAGVIAGNKWYVFGGSNNDYKPNGQLLRLNLETYEWTKLDQKGDVPTPRQSAFLTFYEKNWLLLYGGLSMSEEEIYNTFYFYNVDTKNWSKCEGTYMYQVYARLDPAICRFDDRLYMFGGTYRNMKSEEKYLDDFYEITVATPGRNQSGKISMKRLISPLVPESRSGHNLISLSQQYLILIGGENTVSSSKEGGPKDDISLVQNMWIYNIKYCSWSRLELKTANFRYRSMASCLTLHDTIYLFGGIYSYNCILSDLVKINLDIEALNQIKKNLHPCINCHQKKTFQVQPQSFPAFLIEDITQNIEFPFAAFGMLIDNAMNNGATLLRITYHEYTGSQRWKILKFEDDARLLWSEEELTESLLNFNGGQMYIASGIDKKIKSGIIKDNLRREYGYNIKIASLRLGEAFVFLSFNEEIQTYRIYLFQKEHTGTPHQAYAFYFYTFNSYDKKSSPEMEAIRQKYFSKYTQYIDMALLQRKCRNTLLIFCPKIQGSKEGGGQQQQVELKAQFESNNIVNGSIQKIRELQKAGFCIYECVDVSLRAYITCLYLKNDSMKITLSVKETTNHPTEIQTQIFLQKVDRLCKHKHALQINSAFEFDLKIAEIYYLYDIRKKLPFFNNGLLIYHKNRLITRFKYPLGELIVKKYYKLVENHNFIRLFGFIELPDHIPVNIFKTNYLHHVMMQRLYSRLKFISKLFKKELIKIARDPEYKRAAPTKLNEEQIQQEKAEISQPKPTPSKERSKRSKPVPRQASVRTKKASVLVSFQKSSLEQKIKHLMKEPQRFEQLLKMVQNTKKSSLEPEYPVLSRVKPLASRSVVKYSHKDHEGNHTQMDEQKGAAQENSYKPKVGIRDQASRQLDQRSQANQQLSKNNAVSSNLNEMQAQNNGSFDEQEKGSVQREENELNGQKQQEQFYMKKAHPQIDGKRSEQFAEQQNSQNHQQSPNNLQNHN